MTAEDKMRDITQTRILFAEDNPDNFFLLKTFLNEMGFVNVQGASNGKEILELFFKERESCELIILDIQMPVMSGIEALEQIREHNKNIPVIALTAFALKEEQRRYLAAGFTAYLSKPYKPADLYNVIEECLENSK